MTARPMRAGDVIHLSLPAASAFVGVARSLAAGVASRLDFDLDHVEDLRLAVSEAYSLVLPGAAPDSDVRLDLHIGEAALTLQIASTTTATEVPGEHTFAWTVLRTLADDASADLADGRLLLRLRFDFSATPVDVDDQAGAPLP